MDKTWAEDQSLVQKARVLDRGGPVHREQWFPRSKLKSLHLSPLICTSAGITCPAPTSVKHADIRVKSYNLNSRERYVCNSGFKRKAGTSSLTECVFNQTVNIAHWTTPNLKCIRDPSLTHQTPPSTAAPTGVTPEPDSPNPSGKGAFQYNPRAVTAAISTSVAVLCGVQAYQIPSVEMESMEVVPMTGGTDARGEGTEN
eukprot:bmy_00647T0